MGDRIQTKQNGGRIKDPLKVLHQRCIMLFFLIVIDVVSEIEYVKPVNNILIQTIVLLVIT
jgi:hypothetical protein